MVAEFRKKHDVDVTDVFDRAVIPHSVNSEKAVLGAILLDSSLMDEAMELLRPGDFFLVAHQRMFTAMMEIHRRHEPIDLASLADFFNARNELQKVGGYAGISALVDYAVRTDTVEFHAREVGRKSQVRAIMKAANNILSLCMEDPENPSLVADSQQMIFDACDRERQTGFISLGDAASRYLTNVEKVRNQEQGADSILTGYDDVDQYTLGLTRGDLVILAGRPSNGKTTYAQNIAQNVARQGFSVAFFSQEMRAEQLGEKAVSSFAEVDSMRMRAGCLNDLEWHKAINTLNELHRLGVHISDTSSLTAGELKAKAMRLRRQNGLDLIIVDYLQLLKGDYQKQPIYERVSNNTNYLKAIAKELNVPVLALSQLSRAVEGRADNEPELSHLRESGEIEQAADVVLFIYNTEDTVAGSNATIKIGKNRNGRVGYAKLTYRKQFNRLDSQYYAG